MRRWFLPLLFLSLPACWLTDAEVQTKIDAYSPPGSPPSEAESDGEPRAEGWGWDTGWAAHARDTAEDTALPWE